MCLIVGKRDGYCMDLSGFGQRLATLRIVKGVSAREMSLSVGQSENYINKIENGKSFPSMAAFFDICDYLGISQRDFFDEDNNNPLQVSDMVTDYKRLDSDAQSHIAGLVKRLTGIT